jgi:hypothetical protein
MNAIFKSFSLATLLTFATVCAEAVVIPHSKTIVVESPENLPVLAQRNADAIYLHDTSDGRTLLYIEAQNGRDLTTLDVTNPARIRRLAKVQLPAAATYDFVQEMNDNSVLVRYRDGSGSALISFSHASRPELVSASTLAGNTHTEALGNTGLLIRPSAPVRMTEAVEEYQVVDTSSAIHPMLLTNVSHVRQSLTKDDTGTLFLLNNTGVTVVRQILAEQEHQTELDSMRGN